MRKREPCISSQNLGAILYIIGTGGWSRKEKSLLPVVIPYWVQAGVLIFNGF